MNASDRRQIVSSFGLEKQFAANFREASPNLENTRDSRADNVRGLRENACVAIFLVIATATAPTVDTNAVLGVIVDTQPSLKLRRQNIGYLIKYIGYFIKKISYFIKLSGFEQNAPEIKRVMLELSILISDWE